MENEFNIKKYELRYGPHFNDECSEWCVSKMENEDGTNGAHWSIEETNLIAQLYGINLKGDKFNKYDWFVSLNMIYSDYYKVVMSTFGNSNTLFFVELAKAWINDKDVPEGKTWKYFQYVVCDKKHTEEDEYEYYDEDEDDEEDYPIYVRQYSHRTHSPKHRSERYMEDGEYEYYEPMYRKRKRFSKY